MNNSNHITRTTIFTPMILGHVEISESNDKGLATMNRTPLWKRVTALLLSLSLACMSVPVHAGKITRYVHTDHLGSPVAKTDSTGVVIWRQSYAPYGEDEQGATPDGPGFTGHRNDAATGLVYMQARYYDPEIGRFLSSDPVTFSPDKPQQFNRYWYANGNPYLYTDPDGAAAILFARPLIFRPVLTRLHNAPRYPGFQMTRPQPNGLPPRWPGQSIENWLSQVDKALSRDMTKVNTELRVPTKPQASEAPTTAIGKVAEAVSNVLNMLNNSLGAAGLQEGTILRIKFQDGQGNTETEEWTLSEDGEWTNENGQSEQLEFEQHEDESWWIKT